MKALTLYAPWGLLIPEELKKIETRSWATTYRGPLAIHVSKRIPPEYRSLWLQEPFLSALTKAGIVSVGSGNILGTNAIGYQLHEDRLHLGCVVAICDLANCIRIPDKRRAFPSWSNFYLPPDEPELSFGNYASGRFAWILENIQKLPEPIPARGAQGLWEWNQGYQCNG